jgi:hypothetical protein
MGTSDKSSGQTFLRRKFAAFMQIWAFKVGGKQHL